MVMDHSRSLEMSDIVRQIVHRVSEKKRAKLFLL